MSALPSGTVTFLFSDVVESTPLWERAPAAMATAVARHEHLVSSTMESHGGYIFFHAGDSLAAAFARPADAVSAAIEAQRALLAARWPAEARIRVRMGIHTGESRERDGNYYGPAVNRAARIMSLAAGEQVLASLATEELLHDAAPAGIAFLDLGEVVLKGISGTQRVFQLAAGGLPRDFAPLPRQGEGNLPPGLPSFVGRQEEVARLATDVQRKRVVTLVGVGGVGKTRLALATGFASAEAFADGVWLLEFAPISDADGIPGLVLSTMGLRLQPGISVTESLVEVLRTRRALLLFDNCEHVIEAAAALARALAAGCPGISILATSREPLGLAGEQVWPVASLDPASSATDLFIERAHEADGTFDATGQHEAIAALCRRLDGIPLAIELAAARTRSMTVADIVGRLEDRFRLLRGAVRGRVERHQTLRATVQWSFDLLSPEQQALFARLSVFPGSFDLSAAEAVCADAGLRAEFEIDELLQALVDRSMVTVDRASERTRYRLLETLRQFGGDHLVADEIEHLRDAHAEHYAVVFERAWAEVEAGRYARYCAVLAAEWENARAAAEWDLDRGAQCAARIISSSLFYAYETLLVEVGDWADRCLLRGMQTPRVVAIAAYFRLLAGDHRGAIALCESLMPAATSSADRAAIRLPLLGASMAVGDAARCEALAREHLRSTDRSIVSDSADVGFSTIISTIDPVEAERRVDRATQSLDRLEGGSLLSFGYANKGLLRAAAGDPSSFTIIRQAIEAAAIHQSPRARVTALKMLVIAHGVFGSSGSEAVDDMTSAFTDTYRDRGWYDLEAIVESSSLWAAKTGRPELAAGLVGYLDANGLARVGIAAMKDETTAMLSDHPRWSKWHAYGATLDRDAIVGFALEQLRRAE